MKPHVHLTAIHGIAVILLVFAFFGTLHLLALIYPNNKALQAATAGAGF